MSLYYPQAAVILDIFWEDWTNGPETLNKSYPLVAMPKSITVEINTYKEADTCRFTLDYKNFPFEPRTIRSMRVTVSMANMNFLFNSDGTPNFLTPDDFTGLSDEAKAKFNKQLDESTVFTGFADESEISFNDDNREVVIECRDQTSLLIDRKQPRKTLDLNKSVFDIIRDILDQSKSTKPLQIEVRPPELIDSTPIISSISADINESKKNIKRGESSWDVINDICRRVALVPYVELDKLIITKPRLLFSDNERRLLTWGNNLKNLSFKRKLGRDKGINIEVRSLNLRTKQVVSVKFPEDKLDGTGKRQVISKVVDGKREEEDAPFHVFFLPDINDKATLLDRAEDIWNEMAKQEIEGSLTTKDMILCDKAGKLFKTLDIKIGTPIEIQIEASDLEVLSTLTGKGIEAMRKFLVERCYKPPVATALANTFELMRKFAPVFYTKRVQLRLDHNQGFSANVDFINFIELDPTLVASSIRKGDAADPSKSVVFQFLGGEDQLA